MLVIKRLCVDLKEHNLETYMSIKEAYKVRNHLGTVQATGTGKSYIIAKAIEDMVASRVLFLTSSLHIIDEFKRNFSFITNKITFMTYKKLTYINDLANYLKSENYDFVILDEYHRCGAKTWGKAVKELLSIYKDKKVLGTTATPIRYLDSCRDMTVELFDSEPVVELSLFSAIDKGVLPKPNYILSYYDINADLDELRSRVKLSPSKDVSEKVEYIINNVDKLVNAEFVLKRNIGDARKFIVFCSNVNHVKSVSSIVSRWFKNIGYNVNSYSVYIDSSVKYTNVNVKQELKRFKEAKCTNKDVHLLFSVNILNEGLHIDDVDGLIFLRKTTSPTIMYQQLGRALKSGVSKSPVIFDFVNNINRLSFVGNRPIFYTGLGNSNDLVDYTLEGSIEIKDYTVELNNLLYDIEALSEYSNWSNFINALKEYKKVHNTSNVPSNHRLYKRCLSLRKDYANGVLDSKKVVELNELGFKWEISAYNDELWDEMYGRLVNYVRVHGNANVPRSYSCSKLATWVHTQRKYKNTMPIERKNKLLAIGFIFELSKQRNEDEWLEMYNKLLVFKQKYGHVNVSSRYEDKKLANWVNSQRKAYKASKLSATRYEMLVKIGFKFPKLVAS